MKRKIKNKKAFMLIELLVVVLIIGILAAVALPQYNKAVEKARAVQALTIVKAIADAQEVYFLANGQYAESLDDLTVTVPGTDVPVGQELTRKTFNSFCFGTVDGSRTRGVIAMAYKVDKNGQTEYSFDRFPNDNTFYCEQKTASIPMCNILGTGTTKTINGYTYYVLSF